MINLLNCFLFQMTNIYDCQALRQAQTANNLQLTQDIQCDRLHLQLDKLNNLYGAEYLISLVSNNEESNTVFNSISSAIVSDVRLLFKINERNAPSSTKFSFAKSIVESVFRNVAFDGRLFELEDDGKINFISESTENSRFFSCSVYFNYSQSNSVDSFNFIAF